MSTSTDFDECWTKSPLDQTPPDINPRTKAPLILGRTSTPINENPPQESYEFLVKQHLNGIYTKRPNVCFDAIVNETRENTLAYTFVSWGFEGLLSYRNKG